MANITTQTIRVDLSTDKTIPTAFTHQNDTARTLEFSMYNKGVPYDMTGNTVKFAYKSPIVDGQYSVITGSSMESGTVSGNKVTVTLPVAYTAISGVGMLTMVITPTSGTVRPVNIRLVVQSSADGDNEISSASDFPATLDEIAEQKFTEHLAEYMDAKKNVEFEIVWGKFIAANGTDASSNGFQRSVPIAVNEGDLIVFKGAGYQQNVAMIAETNADMTSITPKVICVDGTVREYNYTATSDTYIVVSYERNNEHSLSIYGNQSNVRLDMRVTDLEKTMADCFPFVTLGVIGDSLANGASNYSGGVDDRPNYSWGKYIQRNHGVETSLFAHGGATTRSWLTASWGLTALQNAEPLECYMIGLGVNDAYSLHNDYLGSVSDVHVGSESENADTYFGNYSKIIAAIKAKSPRAKIFCLTNPKASNTEYRNFNDAIRNIVPLYDNTYLLDLVDDTFYISDDFTGSWNGAHSTAIGYKLIAENIYRNTARYISDNKSDFLDVQWIIENHS